MNDELVNIISAALYKWKFDREWPPATLAMKVYYEDKARFIADEINLHGHWPERATPGAHWGVVTPDQVRRDS